MHDLILIGLPASGKTSVGRALARRLDMPFYDCDEAVETAAGQSVSAIFSQHGETFFRDMESKILEDLCSRERCVIATGGGAVLRQENRLLLRRSGVVFWLDRPLEDIMSTDFQTGRPLAGGGASGAGAAGGGAAGAVRILRLPSYPGVAAGKGCRGY